MPYYYPLHAVKAKNKDTSKLQIVLKVQQSTRAIDIDLPCGICIGCRLERSRQWAVRCMHEASLYDNNCFLTLTYNDQYLPKNGSLVKSDYQDFMKRLRKKYGNVIRYYHCGEYGEKLQRPHYHSILFNHDFQDKKLFKKSGDFPLYTSESLDKLWPFGHSLIGSVTFESANYVAGYVLKKITGEKAEAHYGNRIPEYTTMSRGSSKIGTGGIGKGWYDKYKSDIYPHDRVIVRGHPSRPPRYYDNLLSVEEPGLMERLKIKRSLNGLRTVPHVLSSGEVVQVSDCDSFRLPIREECAKAKQQLKKRSYEGGISEI